MIILVVGLIVFFALHFYSAFRDRSEGNDMKARLGPGPFMALYSTGSLIGLGLIILGYSQALDSAIVYSISLDIRPFTAVGMAIASILIAAGNISPGRIRQCLRHPMVAGVVLASMMHLLSDTDIKDLALFGSFAIWGTIDYLSAIRRPNAVSPTAISGRNDIIAIIAGLAFFIVMLSGLHAALFSVSPW